MNLLRRALVGLPFQASTFSELEKGPQLLGLEFAAAAGTVHMTEDGDLQIDRGFVDAVRSSFTTTLSVEYAVSLRKTLDRSVQRLRGLSATHSNSFADAPQEAVDQLSDIGDALSDVVTLAIHGKFLAGLLVEGIEERGVECVPPFPSPSPGATLATDLAALRRWCEERGCSVSELSATWPDVDIEVAERIERFAADHVGFGPVAWEAPGFDEPAFVVESMAASTGDYRAGHASDPRWRDDGGDREVAAFYGALESWLVLTENGIVLLRQAFHRAILPLVGPVSNALGAPPNAILFLIRAELVDGVPSSTEIEGRRRRYRSAQAYLNANGIDPDRIDLLVASQSTRG